MNFSKREQYAIVVLMLLMFVLLVINMFPGIVIRPKQGPFHNLDSIAAIHGEMLLNESTVASNDKFEIANPENAALEIKLHPFPFNPNKLPAEEWKKIGLNENQIKNILNYEKKGGKFFKKSDLQKIYSLTLAEYRMLEPFIEIPETILNRSKTQKIQENDSATATHQETIQKIIFELNTVDSLQLIEIRNIGPWFAHRILQYRRSLGGYLRLEQLREVYGMDSVKYLNFSPNFTVDPSNIVLLAINRLTFKEMIRHPYMNYNLTKAIINKRERQGCLKNA